MINHKACVLTSDQIEAGLNHALKAAIDGELYLESMENEMVVLDNGLIKSANFNQAQGFGLRAVYDPFVTYAHAPLLDEKSFEKAIEAMRYSSKDTITAVGQSSPISATPDRHGLYTFKDIPLGLEKYVALLSQVDQYVRGKDARVQQVQAVFSKSFQHIEIHRLGSQAQSDHRPMAGFRVVVVMMDKGKSGMGMSGGGGRFTVDTYGTFESIKHFVDEAMRMANFDLEARSAPAGDFPVVLGNGWTGILLHEAVGHGLEGDSNRRKTSSFHSLMGEMVAAEGVTVVDSGVINEARGSLNIDDEGTKTQETVLIENGRLVGFMQDRMNARMMKTASTGNCRRESYASIPMVRMTNTFMRPRQEVREDMIASIQKGVLALQFGSGEVDIASGNFVFSTTEAYMIENGVISYPIKGVTLIGNGPEALKKIKMVGHDFTLDPGVGSCGKDGQMVPVGVGQPSVLISSMTVGGTQV